MKRKWVLTVIVAVAICDCSATAKAIDTAKFLSDVAKQARKATAALTFTITDDWGRARPILGHAICISKGPNDKGTFLSLALSATARPQELNDIRLVVPGPDGKTIKAKFLGMDPSSNIGFVQAEEDYDWQPVKFRKKSLTVLEIGQPVVAAGVLGPEFSHELYLGLGHVATVLRVPEYLIGVTGGYLSSPGSPVFGADGLVVGLVGRQLPNSVVINDGRRSTPVTIQSQQRSTYFMPTEEFSYALENIPTDGKKHRLPWTGVLTFQAPRMELLPETQEPSVIVGKVVPGSPADKAGLRELIDTVVGLNGKPLEAFPTPGLVQAQFLRTLMRCKPGEKLTLTILREGQKRDFVLKLEEMPTMPSEAQRHFIMQLGLRVRDKLVLDKYVSKNPIPDSPGVIVDFVVANSPAARDGINVGDFISVVNGQPVDGIQTFGQIVGGALAADSSVPVNMMVHRGDQERAIAVQPAP